MKKLLLSILCFFSMCSSILAQDAPFTLNLGTSEAVTYYEELPYELVNEKMVVTVIINDKPHKFIWDTGAPVIISQQLFDELQPGIINTIPVKDAFGKADSMNVVSLEKITLGKTGFINTAALVMKADDKGLKCMGTEGLIGSNLLRNSIIQFNSRKQTITLTNVESKLVPNGTKGLDIFKTPSQSNPYIKIALPSKVSVQLLFDTGDDGFLSISNKNYESIKQEKKKALKVIATGSGNNAYGIHGSEGNTTKYRLLAHKISLDNAVFKNVIAETMDDADSRIGAKLLHHGIATVDYKNAKFYFQAFEDQKEIDMTEKLWQIEPTLKDGKIVVGVVWNTAELDVKQGEEIIAIDGRSTNSVDICDLFKNKISPKDKDWAIFTIKDDAGKERAIKNIKQ